MAHPGRHRVLERGSTGRDRERLRYYRKANGLSQDRVAAYAGVTRGAITRLENGYGPGSDPGITRGRAARIAELLQVPEHRLFLPKDGRGGRT